MKDERSLLWLLTMLNKRAYHFYSSVISWKIALCTHRAGNACCLTMHVLHFPTIWRDSHSFLKTWKLWRELSYSDSGSGWIFGKIIFQSFTRLLARLFWVARSLQTLRLAGVDRASRFDPANGIFIFCCKMELLSFIFIFHWRSV